MQNKTIAFITKKELEESIKKLTQASEHITLFTGLGGYFRFYFRIHGREKLPRKMKKRLFKTVKLRRKYLPEYYNKKTNG